MRHHVGLQLGHEIHGRHDDNQQRSAAKIKWYVVLHMQEFRQQANQRDVTGTDERQAHQNLVDVACGLLTWANTGNKRTTLLQVVS